MTGGCFFLFDNDLITKSFELMAEGVKIAIAALKDLYEYIKSLFTNCI